MARAGRVSAVVVFVTAPSAAVGATLAKALISKHVAACVNILPGVRSWFWWEGHVDQAREVLLVIKTLKSRLAELQKLILTIHPYQVPEIIALPIPEGHRPYLDWIASSVRHSAEKIAQS